MTTWVLFIWLTAGTPVASWTYADQAECLKDGQPYKRHVCVKVFVPTPKS